MTNRLLLKERAARQGTPFKPRTSRRKLSGGMFKSSSCQQFSEIAIGDDEFVLDVLEFFFEERLRETQLNDDLRDIAARAVWRATEGSEAMDLVPRPPGGRPGVVWLVGQAVQIAFRRAQNRCIYEAVRVTIKASMRSEYTLAKLGVSGAMQTHMTTSQQGVDMIKGFEAFRGSLYDDPAGHCTIGYGHLVHHGRCDGSESAEFRNGISEARATELLRQRLTSYEQAVDNAVTVDLTQTQFDALVSLCFNIGVDAFSRSTLVRELNAGNRDRVGPEMRRWNRGGGRVLQGLVTRREREVALFEQGQYPGTVSTTQSWASRRTTPQDLLSLGLDINDFEQPLAEDFQAAPVDWCQIRHSIIRSAVEVQGDWLTAGGQLMTENNPAVIDMLTMFWRDGVGFNPQQAQATANLSAQNTVPWSAAFISWCVRNAMPNPPPANNGGFTFSRRHLTYIADALRNREDANMARPFWLHDINEANIVPEDGDILCLNRGGTSHSYQNIKQQWYDRNRNANATGESHGDIVIGHFEDGGRRWIETIGGNVSHTVGSRYYSLDANGRLVDQVLLNGNPIANKRNVTQTVGSRHPIVFGVIKLATCERLA